MRKEAEHDPGLDALFLAQQKNLLQPRQGVLGDHENDFIDGVFLDGLTELGEWNAGIVSQPGIGHGMGRFRHDADQVITPGLGLLKHGRDSRGAVTAADDQEVPVSRHQPAEPADSPGGEQTERHQEKEVDQDEYQDEGAADELVFQHEDGRADENAAQEDQQRRFLDHAQPVAGREGGLLLDQQGQPVPQQDHHHQQSQVVPEGKQLSEVGQRQMVSNHIGQQERDHRDCRLHQGVYQPGDAILALHHESSPPVTPPGIGTVRQTGARLSGQGSPGLPIRPPVRSRLRSGRFAAVEPTGAPLSVGEPTSGCRLLSEDRTTD